MENELEIRQILSSVALNVANDYKYELALQGVNATGGLSNVEFEVFIGEGEYKIYLILEDYWKFVENGRKAGSFPPVNKIMDWIKVKPILPRPMANGKLPTTKQLTFMIGNSIKENGIPARPILANTLEKNSDILTKVKKVLAEGFDKEIKKMLKELNN